MSRDLSVHYVRVPEYAVKALCGRSRIGKRHTKDSERVTCTSCIKRLAERTEAELMIASQRTTVHKRISRLAPGVPIDLACGLPGDRARQFSEDWNLVNCLECMDRAPRYP